MSKFIKKSLIVEAHRWFQNGDHQLDEYERGTVNEGKLVRRYRTPDLDGLKECEKCGYLMHDHGWIDNPHGGHTVCPGDWVIQDWYGGFIACNPDIFKKTYYAVNK